MPGLLHHIDHPGGPVRIIQLTDTHLGKHPGTTLLDMDTDHSLQAVIDLVKRERGTPDLLLATGDLSDMGALEAYHRLQTYFAQLDTRCFWLPGNHDDASLLAEAFPGSPLDTISVSKHGAWQVIRLNSCLPGKPEGRLSENTLAHLEAFLKGHGQTPLRIALHHQPMAVGSPWIDKYPLLNAQALLQLLDLYTGVKAVVWGHIHQVFETSRNGTLMLGGPSSAINASPGGQKFTPGATGSACRWLELRADETLISGIV